MISSLELARLCGVSQGTVDRALHNRGRVSAATRERILSLAARHGYLPNPAARELMTGTSRLVAAIAPSFSSVFFMDIMEVLHGVLRTHGLELLLSTAGDTAEAESLMREFVARRVRALVVVPPVTAFRPPVELRGPVPLIGLVNPLARGVPFVGPDELHTGGEGVRYLTAQKHRRVLFLSYPRRSWAVRARESGYRAAMRDKGCVPRILLEHSDEQLLRAIDSYKPTALFCHNDWLALAAIRTLASRGLRVPHDMSVLGVDNSPTFNRLYPGLTTLAYPFGSIAEAACALILGSSATPAVQPCVVVERDTVRCAQT